MRKIAKVAHAQASRVGGGGDDLRRIAAHAAIAGNREIGSEAFVTNRHWFSCPGDLEILTGQAHDAAIASNEAKRNPYRPMAALGFPVDRSR